MSAEQKGIVVRIRPYYAESLRALWKRMDKLNILPAKTLNEALYNELQNIELRWQDNINEAEEEVGS